MSKSQINIQINPVDSASEDLDFYLNKKDLNSIYKISLKVPRITLANKDKLVGGLGYSEVLEDLLNQFPYLQVLFLNEFFSFTVNSNIITPNNLKSFICKNNKELEFVEDICLNDNWRIITYKNFPLIIVRTVNNEDGTCTFNICYKKPSLNRGFVIPAEVADTAAVFLRDLEDYFSENLFEYISIMEEV